MSKNVNSSQFRTVDVDAYDEDNYEDDEDDAKADLSGSQEVSERTAQVKQLLSMTKNKEALKLALQNPPIGTQDAAIKEQNYDTILSVLKTFKSPEIEGAVQELSTPDVDVLVKYLYKGFSCSPDKAASLLLWHEKAVKKGGLGCVIRVMVDRKGV